MEAKGKVGLITGAANGIGAATALGLARKGADIAIVDLEMEAAARIKGRIKQISSSRCICIRADLSRGEEAAWCVEETVKALGRIDILIHCAGGPALGGLMEVSPESWYKAFDVHVHAIFHLCRAAVPHMKSRREGVIVLMSSAAGRRAVLGATAYGVAKGAIPQFTRLLARELADHGIRVNAVAPGVIRTRFQDYLTPEQVQHNVENRIPLHREGQPEEVAQLITALIENDYITGETVAIDGGLTMRIV
jgi:NAD(P)-dependent dehydrogenase (short-subunit alcohol dehydrogenase family)